MGLGLTTEHKRDPFDDFLDSLKQPRQVMTAEEQDIVPEDPELPDLDEAEEKETPAEQRARYNLSMIPAKTMVNIVDMAFVQVNSMIAKQKVDGATEEEKDSLVEAAANYMKEKDIDISPGAMLVVMVLVVYAPKVWQAVELRKANEKNEMLQRQLEEERAKRELLEAQNTAQNGGE